MSYEQIKSFEDACKASGYSTQLPDLSMIPEHFREPLLAHYELMVQIEAVNREPGDQPPAERNWKPDYNNGKPKYFPVWNMSGPAGAFSYHVYDHWHTRSSVGSRLEYRDRDRERHGAEHFSGTYKKAFQMQ